MTSSICTASIEVSDTLGLWVFLHAICTLAIQRVADKKTFYGADLQVSFLGRIMTSTNILNNPEKV